MSLRCMQHYEREDIQEKDILSITRLGHIERYNLANKLIASGSVVLDAACGCGYGTEILSRKTSYVIGIDRNTDAIRLCQERYGEISNIKFLVADIRDLPFSGSSFDFVVGIEMIEHIHEPEKFVTESSRVLKPKGSLLVSTPYGDNTLLHDSKPFSQYHVKEYRQSEIEELLSDSGFEILQTYGQYIILGAIMRLINGRVKPISNVNAGGIQSIMEKMPFFAEVFSKHSPILKSTSKNMFYHAVKR